MARQVERECFTINEFCRAHRLGRSTYYRLREDGRGPDEFRLYGTRVLITKEAAARWRAARDAESEPALDPYSPACNRKLILRS